MAQKIKFDLVGQDGNIFSLMGGVSAAARKQGIPKQVVDEMKEKVMNSSDYDEALRVIMEYTEEE